MSFNDHAVRWRLERIAKGIEGPTTAEALEKLFKENDLGICLIPWDEETRDD